MKPDSSSPQRGDDPAPEAMVHAAAEWCAHLDAGFAPGEREKFERWLKSDPRHAALFEQMNCTWAILDRASEVPETLLQPPALDGSLPPSRFMAKRVLFWTASVAAAAAVVLGWTLWTRGPGAAQPSGFQGSVQVATGDIKRVDLPDGSVIRMNSATQVAIDYTAATRRVHLVQGEAYFEVARNNARPFVVTAGGASVQAVGTAFNVSLNTSQVEVLVAEGRVSVAPPVAAGKTTSPPSVPLLQAGEKLVIDLHREATHQITAVTSNEISQALAWRDRRLTFDAASLAAIITEFNRFNVHQLVIAPESAELGRQQFGGSFRADDPQTFVELLKTNTRVIAETDAQQTVLRLAR